MAISLFPSSSSSSNTVNYASASGESSAGISSVGSLVSITSNSTTSTVQSQLSANESNTRDWRAMIKLSQDNNPNRDDRIKRLLGSLDGSTVSGLLSYLTSTNGIVFPITPGITVQNQVRYNSQDLPHTNMTYYTYTNTPSPTISISGKFPVANKQEAKYVLCVLHLLRALTKCNFGEKASDSTSVDNLPGMPPPVLFFSAYGDLVYNEVPVIITSFNQSYPEDKDYIEVMIDPTTMDITDKHGYNIFYGRVPTESTIQIDLAVAPSTYNVRKNFSLSDFKSGKLLSNYNSGWTF